MTLHIKARIIYRAIDLLSGNNINIDRLLGEVVFPIESDMAARMYVIYRNTNGDYTLGPVTNTQAEQVMEHREIFQTTNLDMRMLTELLDM